MTRQLTAEQKAAKAERARRRRAAKKATINAARIAATENKPIALDTDGNQVFLGDWVVFKNGIEQYGRVIARDGFAVEVEYRDSVTDEQFTTVVNKFWRAS